MKKWIEIKHIGNLYMEKILVDFNVPILFVCVDSAMNRYLCLDINYSIGQYIIAEISDDILIGMLTDKLTIRDAMCANNNVLLTRLNKQDINTFTLNVSSISDEYLPVRNIYLNIDCIDYIDKIKSY